MLGSGPAPIGLICRSRRVHGCCAVVLGAGWPSAPASECSGELGHVFQASGTIAADLAAGTWPAPRLTIALTGLAAGMHVVVKRVRHGILQPGQRRFGQGAADAGAWGMTPWRGRCWPGTAASAHVHGPIRAGQGVLRSAGNRNAATAEITGWVFRASRKPSLRQDPCRPGRFRFPAPPDTVPWRDELPEWPARRWCPLTTAEGAGVVRLAVRPATAGPPPARRRRAG